jgi:hypothetical protein
MNKKILLAAFAVGMASAAFATKAGAEDGSRIPLEKLGKIPGTMAHLKDVKLTAVPKLPDYIINNNDMKKWDQEPTLTSMMYDSDTPLDIMMRYLPEE